MSRADEDLEKNQGLPVSYSLVKMQAIKMLATTEWDFPFKI